MAEHAWAMVLNLACGWTTLGKAAANAWHEQRASMVDQVIDLSGAGCLLLGLAVLGNVSLRWYRHLAVGFCLAPTRRSFIG